MKNAIRRTTSLTLFAAVASAGVLSGRAQSATSSKEASTIQLPAIQKTGGMPLMEATPSATPPASSPRTRSPRSCWAASFLGHGRLQPPGGEETRGRLHAQLAGRRGSAAVLETGIYAYDAEGHALKLLAAGDHLQAGRPPAACSHRAVEPGLHRRHGEDGRPRQGEPNALSRRRRRPSWAPERLSVSPYRKDSRASCAA